MRQQIRRVRLKDQVADMLVDMIMSGDYGAGDRLPPERILVEQLGVSRTVVREALNLLETRGLIRVDALHNNLGLLLRMEPGTLWELMEMRKALEVEVAGLAAERSTTDDIAIMRVVLDRMRENINAPEGYVDADVEFHNLLARSARNRVFLMMMEPIVDLLLASRRLTGSKEANAKRALRAHETILKKVEAKDVEGARIEMRKHMLTTEHDMRATIGD
jgi:GntR family transcriptional regulator, transcriptional repressor for pyruvate dehydrogenase complex